MSQYRCIKIIYIYKIQTVPVIWCYLWLSTQYISRVITAKLFETEEKFRCTLFIRAYVFVFEENYKQKIDILTRTVSIFPFLLISELSTHFDFFGSWPKGWQWQWCRTYLMDVSIMRNSYYQHFNSHSFLLISNKIYNSTCKISLNFYLTSIYQKDYMFIWNEKNNTPIRLPRSAVYFHELNIQISILDAANASARHLCIGVTYACNTYLALECFYFMLLFSFALMKSYQLNFDCVS